MAYSGRDACAGTPKVVPMPKGGKQVGPVTVAKPDVSRPRATRRLPGAR